MLNVLDFGAVGDGKTDCTKQIQAALDAAAPNRDAIEIPAGVYLTSQLRMPAFTGLVGSAQWGYRDQGGTILKLNDEKAECLINMTDAQGGTLYGLTLLGENLGEAVNGVMVNRPEFASGGGEDTLRIERCRVEAFSGHGLYLNHIWVVSIRHNMISHNGGDGICMLGWDSFILDNWLTGNGGAGYAARGENSACTFTGNRVEWNFGAGMEICGGTHYTINSNYIDRSGGPGLDLKARDGKPCKQITANGNILYRNGKPDRCDGMPYSSSQIRALQTQGLVLTANLFEVAKDDANTGPSSNYSPENGIVIGELTNAIIKDNVLDEGFLKDGLIDLGNHGSNVIIKDNIFTPFKAG